jgi:hypothetical protein
MVLNDNTSTAHVVSDRLDAKSERIRMDDNPNHENPAWNVGNRPRSELGREFLEWKSGVTAETRIAENLFETVDAVAVQLV